MSRVTSIAASIATWFPVLPPVLIYGNWVVARAELGRAPVEMLDDPKHIGGLTTLVHWITAWGLAAGFYAFLASAIVLSVTLLMPRQARKKQLAERLGIAMLGALLLSGWFKWDPGRVISWYLD
jgi:hypothetical protein